MVLAPLCMLLGNALWMLGGQTTPGTLLRWLSYVLFMPAVVGLAYQLAGRRLGLLGGMLSLAGIGGGFSILTLYRLAAVLPAGASGLPVVVEESFGNSPALPATIFLPGALFPLGLLVSGIALYRHGKAQRLPGLLLALGGVLFWVGNALDVLPALFACDSLLLGVFNWLARPLWKASRAATPLRTLPLQRA